ncbi:MAG: rRNA pseudouridine synthase [Planctomycetes bacterium]|nr:rRNA pseudouridine synthase [Planctomycetota bacterium]
MRVPYPSPAVLSSIAGAARLADPVAVTATGKKTLDRAISRAGLCSRAQAQQAIRSGRVAVNGRTVRDPETWVDAVRDKVLVDGAPLRARAKEVWLLHKPTGYVTTAADERGRDTVYALLPEGHGWLGPVGRLDQDSSGLLLFTNDSDLAHAITDPKTKLAKVYEVRCKGRMRTESVQALREGVSLHDGPTLPARVDVLDTDERSTLLRIEIIEGRNRQIRRMVQAVGSRVHTLHRVRIGPLELGDVPEGGCRRLDAAEVLALRGAVRRPSRS